jgi:hypothetical protein
MGDALPAPLNATVARSLRDHGWRQVSVEIIANSRHQVIDEQPETVADPLERYAMVAGRVQMTQVRVVGGRTSA